MPIFAEKFYNVNAMNVLLKRITIDPKVMGGKPCIRGMRVTVGAIIGLLAAKHSIEEILDAYPYLERDDVYAALEYAAMRTQEREVEIMVSAA